MPRPHWPPCLLQGRRQGGQEWPWQRTSTPTAPIGHLVCGTTARCSCGTQLLLLSLRAKWSTATRPQEVCCLHGTPLGPPAMLHRNRESADVIMRAAAYHGLFKSQHLLSLTSRDEVICCQVCVIRHGGIKCQKCRARRPRRPCIATPHECAQFCAHAPAIDRHITFSLWH